MLYTRFKFICAALLIACTPFVIANNLEQEEENEVRYIVPSQKQKINSQSLNPVQDKQTQEEEKTYDTLKTVLFCGNVSIPGECDGQELRVNNIVPADGCDRNPDGITCFRGNVVIDPTKTLYVQSIKGSKECCAPGGDGPPGGGGCPLCCDVISANKILTNKIVPMDPDTCEEKPGGSICIDSNLIVKGSICAAAFTPGDIDENCNCTPTGGGGLPCITFNDSISIGGKLLVNEINPVGAPCTPYENGVTCFSGNVAIPGECDGQELRVNNIVPADGCNRDPDGTTCFRGNVVVDPEKTLYVNSIKNSKDCCLPGDPGGSICIDSNLIVKGSICAAAFTPGDIDENCNCTPTGGGGLPCITFNDSISIGGKLLVNEINPVGNPCTPYEDGITCFSGNVAINPGKTLYVGQICGIDENCQPSEDAPVKICGLEFGGGCVDDLSVKNRLLVNEINPVNPYTCEIDDSGVTCFSGDLAITGYKCIPCIDCDNGSPEIISSKRLLVNNICPVQNGCEIDESGIVTFCGSIAIPGECGDEHKLLVNFVGPVSQKDECALEDCDGVTCFSGNVGIADGRALRTNKITPIVCDSTCCECDPYGTVCVDGNFCLEDKKVLKMGDPTSSGGRLHMWGQKGVAIASNATESELTIKFAGAAVAPTWAIVKVILGGIRTTLSGYDKTVLYEAQYFLTTSGSFIVNESTKNAQNVENNDGFIEASFSGGPAPAQVTIKLKNTSSAGSALSASLFYEIIAEDVTSVS